jgi:hypothetical protein
MPAEVDSTSARLRRPDRDPYPCRAREGIHCSAAENVCHGRAAQRCLWAHENHRRKTYADADTKMSNTRQQDGFCAHQAARPMGTPLIASSNCDPAIEWVLHGLAAAGTPDREKAFASAAPVHPPTKAQGPEPRQPLARWRGFPWCGLPDRWNARRPEALSQRPSRSSVLESQNPVTRCVSRRGFSQGGVRHECTKQTLARLRPGGTGGPGRGYERSRVARAEHLNPWRRAGRPSFKAPNIVVAEAYDFLLLRIGY